MMTDAEGFDSDRETYKKRVSKVRLSHSKNYADFKRDKVQDGDYVYGPDF
jgi:uncharacterized membrane-anchored protein